MGKQYAYIRVSSKEQNEERQRSAMREYGVPAENIILDKQSASFERQGYKKLLKKLRPGDTLIIKSIDRLGRNYRNFRTMADIDEREAGGHRRPDMPLLDTAKPRPHRRFDRGHRAAAVATSRKPSANSYGSGRRGHRRREAQGWWDAGRKSVRRI
ncbi:MAG: recombinase family protein [Cloacibacillus evryensis]